MFQAVDLQKAWMCASLAALMRYCCELSEHVNHVAWGKQATYISWHGPFRWQKGTVCSLIVKTCNSPIPFCCFMLSPDSLPGCHRDARFEPFKGQTPAAPAPSNKYALPCALQCPWPIFPFLFFRFKPQMYFTACFWWLFTAVSFPECIDWHIDWSQNDGYNIYICIYIIYNNTYIYIYKLFSSRTIIQDLLGPVALMATMDRASVMRLIRCLLQWNVPEEACLTWWPTW